MRPAKATGHVAPPRRVGKTSLISNTATNLRHISKRSTDLLQSAGSLQPGGRSRPEPATVGTSEALVGISSQQQKPQPIHVRAAGTGGEGATRSIQGRQEGVRSEASSRAD